MFIYWYIELTNMVNYFNIFNYLNRDKFGFSISYVPIQNCMFFIIMGENNIFRNNNFSI